MKYNINFLPEDRLYQVCEDVIKVIKNSRDFKECNLYKNIVDPFSAIFEASYNKISLRDWLKTEEKRQIQKTLQNEIGAFHQKILGSVYGWEALKSGSVVDLISEDKKIIAEIKNKFNTTKGNHKIAIYDDFCSLLNGAYIGYTAYYVAILSRKKVNRPFTPSDNRAKSRRGVNENIREVDGVTFYEMVTGDKDSLYKIYKAIPQIISEILTQDTSCVIKDPLFDDLFKKAFK